jgi:hypothetical protein
MGCARSIWAHFLRGFRHGKIKKPIHGFFDFVATAFAPLQSLAQLLVTDPLGLGGLGGWHQFNYADNTEAAPSFIEIFNTIEQMVLTSD